jgi:hypothetical protein
MSTVRLSRSPQQLKEILERTAPGWPLFPELEGARRDLPSLTQAATTRRLLASAQAKLGSLYPIPQTPYTLYREFRHTGARRGYERPYFEKRSNLTAATLALFLGQDDLLDAVHDYLWDICEETNWVLPAHERRSIDLFAAETGFQLAETLSLLDGRLAEEVIARVRAEIEERITTRYLAEHESYGWYRGHSNWNGVCNGSVGNTFLLLEGDTERLALALATVLEGLEVFLDTAFEEDGGSTEGVGYWQYGLMNVIAFSEMLRQRTQGKIDILSTTETLRKIALYPLRVMLSPGRFFNISDSEERSSFHPGIVTRLAERTEQPQAKQILAGEGALLDLPWRLCNTLRTMLWWDGTQPQEASLHDAYLPAAGAVWLVTETAQGMPVSVALKAGHNAENHNHNDVGTFVVHADGETYLCDPGRGLYSRQYFSATRYDNVFANSFGHSLPVIGGELQAHGRERAGEIQSFDPGVEPKQVAAEIGSAYPVPALQGLLRTIRLETEGEAAGTVMLIDTYRFEEPQEVQEAFVTWLEAEVQGNRALIHGEKHDLKLTIEAPEGAALALASLEEACEENAKEEVLKRISADLPAASNFEVRVRIQWRDSAAEGGST